jgi:hypothetical protein
LLLVFAAAINAITISQRDNTYFFYAIEQLLIGILFFLTMVYSIIKIIRDKRQIPGIKKFHALILSLLLIATFPIVSYIVNSDGGKTVIMQASAGGDLTYVQLDLRDDGSCKLLNSGPFGGQYYRGHYTLRNDTLHIDNGDLNLYPTLTFILRQDSILQRKYFDPVPEDTTKESIYKLYIRSMATVR